MKITSVNNELIKECAKLKQHKYREESGLFLLEGDKCIEEAMSCGINIKHLFIQEGYNKFQNKDIIEVTEHVLSKIASTSTPPKTIAVAEQPKYKWKSSYKKVVLLEDIKDAGNLGTILRTCAAFNVDALVLYGDTVDLYNPKCVRASVGNLWKIPVFSIGEFEELELKFSDYERLATLPAGINVVNLEEYKKNSENILIMFGAESSGLSEQLKKFATKNLTISMNKEVESLNLSISAGIVLYKLM